MRDLIDRKAAINAIEQMQLPIMRSDLLHEQFIFQGLSEALAAIKELPSAQPKEMWNRRVRPKTAIGVHNKLIGYDSFRC